MLLTWILPTEARYVAWMFSAIYGLHWLHALIMETVQLHMVHVKEILGCHLHCSAPRYQKGMMVNPGHIKEELTAENKARLFISVSVQWEPALR